VVFITPTTTLTNTTTPTSPHQHHHHQILSKLSPPADSQHTHAFGCQRLHLDPVWNAGSLMKTWQGSTPDQKTVLVTELSQILLGISRDEAQSLPLKDLPALSLYEKVFSLLHRHKRHWEHLSSRNSTSMETASSKAIGSINAEAASTEDVA